MASLHEAFDKKLFCHVLLLLDHEHDPDAQDKNGQTILMKCCGLEDQKTAGIIASKVLKKGAMRDIFDKKGRSALSYSAIHNQVKICKMIMARSDLDINKEDIDGNTSLHLSVKTGSMLITKLIASLLFNYNLSVDVYNDEGLTPLMVACANGDLKTARFLIHETKASLTIRDNKYFKNAQDWLETELIVPENLNPFKTNIPVEFFVRKHLNGFSKVSHTIKRTSRALPANVRILRRPSSAGPTISGKPGQLVVTANRPKSATPQISPWVPCFGSNDHSLLTYEEQHLFKIPEIKAPLCGSNIMFQLFTLYAIQSSDTFRPPVSIQSEAEESQVMTSEIRRTDGYNKRQIVKARIQKVIRLKRAESVFSSFRKTRSDSQRKLSINSTSKNPVVQEKSKPQRRRSAHSDPGQSTDQTEADSKSSNGDTPGNKLKIRRQMSQLSLTSSSTKL